MNMKKMALVSLAVIAAAVVAGKTYAGLKLNWLVSIDTTNRMAGGAMGAVRNSADSTQHIECGVSAYSSGYNTVGCQAVNSAGQAAWCTSTNPTLIAAAHAITDGSHIQFQWDANYYCTYIGVMNASYHTPPLP